jgi:hypothetical protein
MTAVHLTIDSCVIGHAQNPQDQYFECSSAFFDRLLAEGHLFIVVDSGGLLWSEYDDQLGSPSFPREVLTALLEQDRVETVAVADLPRAMRTLVTGLISRHKPRDRTLAYVGILGSEFVVTDDYEDFTAKVRSELKRRGGVAVLDSCEVDAIPG